MDFSCLVAVANNEASTLSPTPRYDRCCILTRNGGCKRDSSKYKFQNLISKFELYNIEPPVLKQGYDVESARICKEHNRLHPKTYKENERPDVLYDRAADYLEREDEIGTETKVVMSRRKRRFDDIESSSGNEEWDGESDCNNNQKAARQRQSPDHKQERKSAENSRQGTGENETGAKEKEPKMQVQERHCIYLKAEDDEKCRSIAQKMGLARGPNGYNRSALLAKMPRIVAENTKIKEQLTHAQEKLRRFEQFVPQSLPLQEVIHSDEGEGEPELSSSEANAKYGEVQASLSAIKKSSENLWVHLVAKNTTEDEILQILDLFDGGKIKRKIFDEYSEGGSAPKRRASAIPTKQPKNRQSCEPARKRRKST